MVFYRKFIKDKEKQTLLIVCYYMTEKGLINGYVMKQKTY